MKRQSMLLQHCSVIIAVITCQQVETGMATIVNVVLLFKISFTIHEKNTKDNVVKHKRNLYHVCEIICDKNLLKHFSLIFTA